MASLLVTGRARARVGKMIHRMALVFTMLALIPWPATGQSQRTGRKPVVPVVRQTSSLAPIEVVAPDSSEAALALETAEQTWKLVASTLQVQTPPDHTRITLQWVVVRNPTPASSHAPWEFPSRAGLGKGNPRRKEFTIEYHGTVREGREALVRSLTNVCLQAIAWDGQTLEGVSSIARPPFWLSEGLVQRTLGRRVSTDSSEIIHRMDRARALPKLAEIQGWEDGGELRAERIIRQAVAYWLLRQATLTPVEAQSLKLWWQSQRQNPEARYWDDGGSREAWWREVAGNRGPTDLPIYTWEQTASHVREALHFSTRLKDEKESRILSVLDLPDSPDQLESPRAVQEVGQNLAAISSRAHWLWPYVINRYRAAIDAWNSGNQALYRKRIEEALVIQQRMDAVVRQSSDFLDWFTVNYGLKVDDPEWEDFRKLAREMEDARAPFRGPAGGGTEKKRATDGT